jgi:hypothetical protein
MLEKSKQRKIIGKFPSLEHENEKRTMRVEREVGDGKFMGSEKGGDATRKVWIQQYTLDWVRFYKSTNALHKNVGT